MKLCSYCSKYYYFDCDMMFVKEAPEVGDVCRGFKLSPHQRRKYEKALQEYTPAPITKPGGVFNTQAAPPTRVD